MNWFKDQKKVVEAVLEKPEDKEKTWEKGCATDSDRASL
jgi:hypothetical protein